jgi:hypothetical protein
MPVARYFLFVGAALLALLYAAGAFFPGLPSEPTIQSAADAPVIRIHSDRKWPERVVFDTRVQSMPAATTMVAAKTDAVVVPPATFDDLAAKARVRDAFAQLVPDEPKQVASAEPKKPQPPPQPHKRKVAKASIGSPKTPVGPPTILVAQQPRFGFFANNLW